MACKVAPYSSFSESHNPEVSSRGSPQLQRICNKFAIGNKCVTEEETRPETAVACKQQQAIELFGKAAESCKKFSKHSLTSLPKAWWDTQMAESIHNALQNREHMLDTIKLASPQLQKRIYLVNFITTICNYLPISDTTRHLAVLLMDHFMEKHSIMDFRLKLVALTCLLVAAKLEEREDHLPTIKKLKDLAQLNNMAEYNRENFQKMELYLMKFFNWSISYPTAAHFIGYYTANSSQLDELNGLNEDFLPDLETPQAELLSDSELDFDPVFISELDDVDVQLQDSTSFHHDLEEITGSLLEIALRDYRFLQFTPSMVAAGTVCMARVILKIPSWTPLLELRTGYSKQCLTPVVQLFNSSGEH